MQNHFEFKGFWKNIFRLVSYSILSQVIIVIFSPLLTRVYLPEQIGVAAVLINISSILVTLSTLRIERAIVLQKNEELNLTISTCFFFLIFFVSLTLVSIVFAEEFLSNKFGIQKNYFYYIPLFVLLLSTKSIFFETLNQQNLYKIISIITFSITSFTIISKVTLGYFYSSSITSLVFSELFVLFVLNALVLIYLLNKSTISLSYPSFSSILSVINKNSNFVKYDIVSSFLNIASWMMPALILSIYFDTAVVGFYTLAFSMLKLPMKLLGTNIGMVFYREVAQNTNDESEVKFKTTGLVTVLFLSGILPIFFVFLFGSELFGFVFGENWKEAGKYAEILSLWTLFWLISSPISNLYYTLSLQKSYLIFMILSVTLRLGALLVGGLLDDVILSIYLFSIVSLLLYLLQIIYLFSKVSVAINEALYLFYRMLIIVLPFAVPMFCVSLFASNLMISLVLCAIIILFFYAYLFKTKKYKILISQ